MRQHGLELDHWRMYPSVSFLSLQAFTNMHASTSALLDFPIFAYTLCLLSLCTQTHALISAILSRPYTCTHFFPGLPVGSHCTVQSPNSHVACPSPNTTVTEKFYLKLHITGLYRLTLFSKPYIPFLPQAMCPHLMILQKVSGLPQVS